MIIQVTLPEIKNQWNKAYEANALRVPFLAWSWHNNWQTVFGDSYQPYYLLINNNVIAPFVKNDQNVLWSGGEEIADYLDLIGPDNAKESALQEIIKLLKKENITSVSLRNVPENSPTIEFFKNLPGSVISQEDTTPTIPLPTTWESFVESVPSRKYRHELERKIRKFEREHPDTEIHQSTDPKRDIDTVLALMEKDADKKTFLTEAMKTIFRKTAETFT